MSREIDAKVAEAMGLEVLGEAWSSRDWEVTDWWHVHTEKWEGRTLQPVYIGRCSCDLYPSDMPELDPTEKVLGHYAYCLEVVKHYTTDIAAAWQVVEWITVKRPGGFYWRFVLEKLCPYNRPPEWTAMLYSPSEGPAVDGQADNAPLAICKAFLKAMGEEVGE